MYWQHPLGRRLFAGLVAALALGGCAGLFEPSKDEIQVFLNPDGRKLESPVLVRAENRTRATWFWCGSILRRHTPDGWAQVHVNLLCLEPTSAALLVEPVSAELSAIDVELDPGGHLDMYLSIPDGTGPGHYRFDLEFYSPSLDRSLTLRTLVFELTEAVSR